MDDDLHKDLFGADHLSDSNSDLDILLDEGEILERNLVLNLPIPPSLQLLGHQPECITDIPGLLISRNLISPDLCALYFNWLESRYFSSSLGSSINGINQGLHFGTLLNPATPLGYLAYIARQLLPGHEFNQAIINMYDPGQGIGDHVDLLRFGDGICGFSFGCAAQMRMIKVDGDVRKRAERYAEEKEGSSGYLVDVRVGDVYVLSREARFQWTHGFPRRIGEVDNVLGRRISVTLRWLLIDS
ncbi:hypothetical protein BX661DRAFT_185562 [Kickxella alabastrina]|uniref:uncharacterized protein n=1 Tax=Kickxella alabastrina TaxID=61397 RepID=UPI0022204F39|nr:uncharacterized protein BX661DRAFT_185562 [Kickxella alabastrina]KAI7824572.1 hypothetical protein BX661DRAFT_185562 [Kickxella alabastrina]